MNLTAIRDRSQQITKHLLDSLSAFSRTCTASMSPMWARAPDFPACRSRS